MKRGYLTAISIIFILTIGVSLAGCGIKGKSDAFENYPSKSSNNNRTSIPNSSPASATAKSTQPSNSSPSGSIDEIDYNQYINKVWVVKDWNNGPYIYPSFRISKIANGEIEGKFSTGEIAKPDYYYYLPDHLGYLGNLTGTIQNSTAEGQFSDKQGDSGDVKFVFRKNDEIEATIKYTNKSEDYKDLSLDGTYLFKPYNLKDIEGFSPFNDQSFTVDLNSWGTVRFVSGKIVGGVHIPTVAYLTNNVGDIFYDFTTFIPNNVDFYAVSFKDINKDELKDIIIIYGVEEDDPYVLIYFQKPDGSFYNDSDLDEEIKNSLNNVDIKSVTDYLSKKF